MTKPLSPAKARFGFQLAMLARRWRKAIQTELDAVGLTDATWSPLMHLAEAGEGISQTELAERLALDGSTVVRLLDILAGRGLIERRVNPDDRRARLIALTQAGESEVARIKAHLAEVESFLLAGLGEGEVSGMLDAFGKISAAVETALEKTAQKRSAPEKTTLQKGRT